MSLIETDNNTLSKKPLYGLFTAIPPRYDLINNLITLGMDRGWRKKAALTCLYFRPQKVLDLCCGTGDMAINLARLADYHIEIQGLDYSQPMLDIAAQKARELKDRSLCFTRGEVSQIPFPEADFDSISISFAFRNLTYQNPLVKQHIAEILRVLKPGGHCVIVESSQPSSSFIRACDHFYMRQYVYHLGAWLSGNKAAYRYLAESACHFYSPAELSQLLRQSGFKEVAYRALFFGAAGIYTATK